MGRHPGQAAPVVRPEVQAHGQVDHQEHRVVGRQGRKLPTVRRQAEAEVAVSNGSQIRIVCRTAARPQRMRARREVIPRPVARARQARDHRMLMPTPRTGNQEPAARERDHLLPTRTLATGQPARERNPPLPTPGIGKVEPAAQDRNRPLRTPAIGKAGPPMQARAARQEAKGPARRRVDPRHNNEAVRPVAARSTARAEGAVPAQRVREDRPVVAAEAEAGMAVEDEDESSKHQNPNSNEAPSSKFQAQSSFP
jgi:hypothetical protein